MKDLVILGTGGFAREVHQLLEDCNAQRSTWNVVGFLDDHSANVSDFIHNLPILGPREWLEGKRISVAVGLGVPHSRRRIVDDIRRIANDVSYPTLVHPTAWIGNRIKFGTGVIVCAGARLTTDLTVGDYVHLNLNTTVGHDSVLHDFVTAAPAVNVSGAVNVGTGCDLGTGSTIIQGINVGAWTVVGAGAVVVRDLPPNVTAVGTPAKPIKERPEGWHLA